MKHDTIDYNQCINEVELMLKGVKHESVKYNDGKRFSLFTNKPPFELSIEITSKWIGYDLKYQAINKRWLGYIEDTDNYPLNYNSDITIEIFNDLKTLLHEVLNKEIMYGEYGCVAAIARSSSETTYTIKIFRPKKWLQNQAPEIIDLNKEEAVSKFSLSPIE